MDNKIREVPVRKMFPDMPRFEPEIMDSSAMSVFKKCPRKYFYQIVLGYVERETPPYLPFGSALHKVMELWFKNANDPNKDLLAIKAGMAYHQEHISPMQIQVGSKYDFYTLERLVLSAKMLIEYFKKEAKEGKIEVLASEQIITTTLPNGASIGGRSDQITRWSNRLVGRDLKTTSIDLNYYERDLEPNDQFSRYTYIQERLAGEPILGQFVLVVHNSKGTKAKNYKDGGPEIKQILTTRSAYQLETWANEAMAWMKRVDECRETDEWPMNEQSCKWCPFRKACSSGSAEGVKSTIVTQFKHKPWDFTAAELDG